MTNFFEKKDRWGHGLALWVLVLMIPPMIVGGHYLKRIKLENDVENWLPKEDTNAITLDWYLSHFPNEETIFITWKGSSINDPRIKLLERKLEGVPDSDGIPRGGVPYVDRVSTPQEGLKRMLKQLSNPDEAVRRMTGLLIGRGPLKVRLTDVGRSRKRQTIAQIESTIQEKLGISVEILDPFYPPEIDFSRADADLLEEILAAEAARLEDEEDDFTEDYILEIAPHDLQVTFRGINYSPQETEALRGELEQLRSPSSEHLPEGEPLIAETFFQPGTPVSVLVRLSEGGVAEKEKSIEAIRQAALSCAISPEILHMGGRTVASAALNVEVKKSARNERYPASQFWKRSPILTSMLLGMLLSFFMLKSVRLAVLVLVSSLFTVYLSLALVPATDGSMNMVLVVMPTLLMVLTMSGAIHVANYWKHAVLKTPQRAVPEAYRMAFTPCLLASVTTAIGMSSLGSSSLVPVKDFGIYSSIGCLIGFVAVMYCLPSMLQFWPARAVNAAQLDSRPWHLLGGWLCRHHLPVTILCLGFGVWAASGLRHFSTETKVIRYFPDDSEIVADYHFIEDNLVNIVPVDTIVRFDAQARKDLTFVERMELVRRIEERIRQHPEISGAVSLADLFDRKSIPPREERNSIQGRLFIRNSRHLENKVFSEERDASSLVSRAIEPGAEPVPAKERSKNHYRLSSPEDELWRISAQVAIMSNLDYGDLTDEIDEIAQSELKLHPGTEHIVTGMVPIFLRTQEAVLESLIRSFAFAFALIALVLMIVLKDPLSGLLTMLPNLWPVGVVFGLISWYGIDVDIGTMITASVALGIAIDGTLHLLTWFRQGIREGLSREEAIGLAMGHCAPAMWQTSMIIGLGMFILSFADLLLVSRFGWLMASLILAAMFADLILLPAMLAGSLGRFIARRIQSEESSEPPPAELSESADDQGRPPAPSVREPHLQSYAEADRELLRKNSGLSPNH
jgi:uncharacterized protein